MSVTYTYNAPSGDETFVSVSFTDGTITFDREVNAVFTDSAYDATLTEERVAQVASSVENKISIGLITATTNNPAPNPEG